MESRAKFLGHPIHPMLVVFPLGLFIAAVVFDLLYLWTAAPMFAAVSYWNIVGGLIGGVGAAIFGLIDWAAIPERTRAKRIGLWHGLGNGVVILLFAASWYLRQGAPDYLPTNQAIGLGVGAIMLGAVTGWLGGELVDRLGVGVDDGAHLNAPSSLAERRRERRPPREVPSGAHVAPR